MKYNPDNDDRKDIDSIKNAIDLGITHIDTAELYAEGNAEMIIGKAIKGYSREKLFIASKASPVNLKYKALINSAKGSLKRMGIYYIDLYFIHFPNPKISISESMEAMNFLKDEGLIRYIGISNFSLEQLKEAERFSENKIVATQLHYNLIYREPEVSGLLNYCQENDIMIIAWRPVQKGVLTDNKIEILNGLCKKYEKTPAQIAINWLVSKDNVVTISKTSSTKHLKENMGALNFKMDPGDIRKLTEDFPIKEFKSETGNIYKHLDF